MARKIDERVEWHENDKATLHVTEEDEIHDDKGDVVGTTTKTYTIRTDREALEDGINSIHTTISNLKKRAEQTQKKLQELGEPVTLTPQLKKLQGQIQSIQRYQEQQKQQSELDSIQNDLKVQQDILARRSASLHREPKKGGSQNE